VSTGTAGYELANSASGPSDLYATARTKSELTAGAKIIAFVAKQSDGTLSSKRVLVGRDGITPPM
jgi:hypothetical protein